MIYTHIHTGSNAKQTKQQNYIVTVYFKGKRGEGAREASAEVLIKKFQV
jgi:hypothetical protein